jgi:tetratricopeptide (TPR) repeat protein
MKLEIKRLEENTSFSDNISKNHLRLISLRLMLNKSDKRVLYYINTAIRKQGNTKEILYLSALYNYSLFCSEYKKEYIQKAISILKKLNNNHPYFSDAYYLLSVIYLNGRIDLERASKSLSTLLKTCPGYDRIKVVNMIKVVSEGLLDEAGRLFGIGKKIYAKTGSDYALDYLLRAHKKDEKNEEIVMVLGEVYKKKDNFDKAVFYYKKAVSSANWNPGIYLALGNAYYAKFLNTPENINDLRKTLKLKSGFPFTEEGLNKLKERLTAVKNEAIKAYKTYIQQRMPFVVHPLHPSNPKNLVRILETLNISKGYLQNRIGLFFLKHDRYDEAINIFRKTLIASPNDRYTMLNLLSTFEKKNDRAGITNTLTRLAETFKNDLKLHIKLAAFYYEHKDFKNSLKYYIAASKLDDGIEANIGLGKAYFMLGNTEEAKKHYLKAISKMKNDQSLKNPECYFLLANIYMDEGKINLAIQNYLTALTGIKVNTFTAKFNLQKSMLREIYNKLSSLNLYMGNYVKAFNWLVEARIFDPSNRHKYEIALADILFLNKRFKYAISYYSDALNAEKNNPDLLFKIAVCYKELNQPRRSLKTLLKLKAVAKNKIKLQPLLFTGDIYLELGNKEKAYQNYSLALKKHPHDYRPYIKLALILKELNKSGEAARIIASNVYYIKQRYDISSFLAWYMAERNLSIQKALLWAKKAVLASPSNLTYLKTLAFLYYKSGDILNYFRVIKKTERLATELNIISTDYYNYFYSYQKACGYFRNKNFIMAVSILNNMRSILKLVHNEEIRSAAGSNQNNAVR